MPDWAAAWVALGEAAERLGDVAAAQAAYRRAEPCPGGEALGAGLRLRRLEGLRHAPALPAAYVAALFDDYAPRFDSHLVEGLGYRGPAVLLDALHEAGAPPRFGRVLDLGCGTGLMGRAIRPRADRLMGVDLSPAMIEVAAATGLYDDLAVDALESTLARHAAGSLDLTLAADVFVYCGDLHPVVAAATAALAPGGLLAFTAQRGNDSEPVRLGDDLRVSHSAGHLRGAIEAAGLLVRHLADVSTRRENGIDMPGLVAVASKP